MKVIDFTECSMEYNYRIYTNIDIVRENIHLLNGERVGVGEACDLCIMDGLITENQARSSRLKLSTSGMNPYTDAYLPYDKVVDYMEMLGKGLFCSGMVDFYDFVQFTKGKLKYHQKTMLSNEMINEALHKMKAIDEKAVPTYIHDLKKNLEENRIHAGNIWLYLDLDQLLIFSKIMEAVHEVYDQEEDLVNIVGFNAYKGYTSFHPFVALFIFEE